jgi:hypothetical protein
MDILELPTKEQIDQDKSLKRMIKSVAKIRTLKSIDRMPKFEELVRYIVAKMVDRKHDSLLLTTAVWCLLNLIQLESVYGIDIMLRVGVPAALHTVLSPGEVLSTHTRKYASELISQLW